MMRKAMAWFVFFGMVLLIFLTSVLAYETYDISASDLEAGYTKDLSLGDRINFPIDDNSGYVSVLSVFVNGAEIGVYAHDTKMFYTQEHPNVDIMPSRQKFEMTEDNYYDVEVTLNSAVVDIENGTRAANITLKKIHEEIPEGTEIAYGCWRYHECLDGSRIKYCDYSGTGCGCRSVSFVSTSKGAQPSECPPIEEEEPNSDCKNYYWFDNEHKNCEQKQFCGAYMYQGLQTFETKGECEAALNNFANRNCPEFMLSECIGGELVPQGLDDNGCPKIPKCMKQLSNGRKAEIKIMPETASLRARERLGELGFNVSLKEVGKGDNPKVVYELRAEKEYKIFGLFKKKANVEMQVDAESGEVIAVKKPWWIFFAFER